MFSDGRFEGVEAIASATPFPSGGRESPGSSGISPSSPESPLTLTLPAEPGRGDNSPVTLHVIGERSGNVGIVQFQVRRSLVDPLGYEILAEVRNASDKPAECRFEVELNDEPIDVVLFKLEAGGRWSQVFEKTSAEGAI